MESTHQHNTDSTLFQTIAIGRTAERNRTNEGHKTKKTKERWQRKRMHGKFPRNSDEKLVNEEHSYRRQK
jgi:hypothetical protein